MAVVECRIHCRGVGGAPDRRRHGGGASFPVAGVVVELRTRRRHGGGAPEPSPAWWWSAGPSGGEEGW